MEEGGYNNNEDEKATEKKDEGVVYRHITDN